MNLLMIKLDIQRFLLNASSLLMLCVYIVPCFIHLVFDMPVEPFNRPLLFPFDYTLVILYVTILILFLHTKQSAQALNFLGSFSDKYYALVRRFFGKALRFISLQKLLLLVGIVNIYFSLLVPRNIRYSSGVQLDLSPIVSFGFYLSSALLHGFMFSVLACVLIFRQLRIKTSLSLSSLPGVLSLIYFNTGIRPLFTATFYLLFISYALITRSSGIKQFRQIVAFTHKFQYFFLLLALPLVYALFSYLQLLANSLVKNKSESLLLWNIARNSSHMLVAGLSLKYYQIIPEFNIFGGFLRPIYRLLGLEFSPSLSLNQVSFSLLNSNSSIDILGLSTGASPGLLGSSLLILKGIGFPLYISLFFSFIISILIALIVVSYITSSVNTALISKFSFATNSKPAIALNQSLLSLVLFAFLLIPFFESPTLLFLNPFLPASFFLIGSTVAFLCIDRSTYIAFI
jgi:hypothetical protein